MTNQTKTDRTEGELDKDLDEEASTVVDNWLEVDSTPDKDGVFKEYVPDDSIIDLKNDISRRFKEREQRVREEAALAFPPNIENIGAAVELTKRIRLKIDEEYKLQPPQVTQRLHDLVESCMSELWSEWQNRAALKGKDTK